MNETPLPRSNYEIDALNGQVIYHLREVSTQMDVYQRIWNTNRREVEEVLAHRMAQYLPDADGWLYVVRSFREIDARDDADLPSRPVPYVVVMARGYAYQSADQRHDRELMAELALPHPRPALALDHPDIIAFRNQPGRYRTFARQLPPFDRYMW